MRRAAKIDGNQPDIVAALRKCGATVQPLHTVGQGVPDLLVGFRRQTLLIEVKDGSRPPSERKLTDDQAKWHKAWEGHPVYVVKDVPEAISVLARAHLVAEGPC